MWTAMHAYMVALLVLWGTTRLMMTYPVPTRHVFLVSVLPSHSLLTTRMVSLAEMLILISTVHIVKHVIQTPLATLTTRLPFVD